MELGVKEMDGDGWGKWKFRTVKHRKRKYRPTEYTSGSDANNANEME